MNGHMTLFSIGDYLSQNPESIHQVCILFSDRGTPDGFHQMHGYSGHTMKFVNAEGKFVYYQMHFRADKGFKTLTNSKAAELTGTNPDYGIQSLFEDIEKGNYPTWTVYIVCGTIFSTNGCCNVQLLLLNGSKQ
jgi:catalase